MGLDALFPLFVVALAVGRLCVGLRVGQVVHHALIGARHLLRQAAVLLLHVGEDLFHGLGAPDLPAGHLLRHRGGVAPLAQGLVYVDAPLGEVVEVFLGGLVRQLHAAQARNEHRVVALVEGEGGGRIRQSGEDIQGLVRPEGLDQALGVPRDLVVGVVGHGGHVLHVGQEGRRFLLRAQQGGKGHLLLFPPARNGGTGGDGLLLGGELPLRRLLHVAFERLVL